MNTKLIMTFSAFVMGLTGIALTFMPEEILVLLKIGHATVLEVLILQVLGALYFAFAMINWTAKANLIGGIYGRPIAIGNLTHFVIGALALIKGYVASGNTEVLVMGLPYLVFGILFTIIFFTHPVPEKAT